MSPCLSKKKNRAAFDLINTEQQDPMHQTIRDHRHTAAAAAAEEMDHITDPNTRTKKLFDSLGKKPEIPANNIDSARRNE